MARITNAFVYNKGKEYAIPVFKKIDGKQYKLHCTEYCKSDATALVNSLRHNFKRNSYRIVKWRKNAPIYMIYKYVPPLTRKERKEKKEMQPYVDKTIKYFFR